jgi:hypothetical protein
MLILHFFMHKTTVVRYQGIFSRDVQATAQSGTMRPFPALLSSFMVTCHELLTANCQAKIPGFEASIIIALSSTTMAKVFEINEQ